jgi:hypothetical protein
MLYNGMATSPLSQEYNIKNLIKVWDGFIKLKEGTDETKLNGKMLPPIVPEIAGYFFSKLPPQSLDYLLTSKPSEEEYPFLPLMETFSLLSTIKKQVDDKKIAHYEGVKKLFKDIDVNIVVTGLQYSGKTHHMPRLVSFIWRMIYDEKTRNILKTKHEANIEYLKKSKVKPKEIESRKDEMKVSGLYDESNPLEFFAASTDVKMESTGAEAKPSTDVETAIAYCRLAILNFKSLPGQRSYKKGTSEKIFQLYDEIEVELGEETSKIKKKITNIDDLLENSSCNYVMLFANIDRNNIFKGSDGVEFVDYIFNYKGKFREVCDKLNELHREYNELHEAYKDKVARGKTPNPDKLMKRIIKMYDIIEDAGFSQIANLFLEAAMWNIYTITNPNTKIMGVVVTGVDLKDKVGKKIIEDFRYFGKGIENIIDDEEPKVKDELWNNLFSGITEFLSTYVPTFPDEYFKLGNTEEYSQGEGSYLMFLGQIYNRLIKDIQVDIIDPGIEEILRDDKVDLSLSEIQTLLRLRFDVPTRHLKQVFDENGHASLAGQYIYELMNGYPEYLDIPMERLMKLKFNEGYILPDVYDKKVEDDLSNSADLFIQFLERVIPNPLGVDIEPFEDVYNEVKEKFGKTKQKKIKGLISQFKKARERAEKEPQMTIKPDFKPRVPIPIQTQVQTPKPGPPVPAPAPTAPAQTMGAPPSQTEEYTPPTDEEGITDFRKSILTPVPKKEESGLLENKPLSDRQALQDELKTLFRKKRIN